MNIPHADKKQMAMRDMTLPFTLPGAIPMSYTIDGETFHGIPKWFRPTFTRCPIDANLVQFRIEGRHPSGVRINVEYNVYKDFPVTEWLAFFTNDGGKGEPLVSDIRILDTVLKGASPVLTHSNGDTCGEDGYEVWKTPMTEPFYMTPMDGTSCRGASPYFRMTFGGAENPRGLNIAVGWPAMWDARFTPDTEGVHVSVGQKRCHMRIKPGETIRTPRITMQAFAGDESVARNLWRRWYFMHILPREDNGPLTPKLCLHVWNVGGAEHTGATETQQVGGIQQYVDRGMTPDVWWIDAGWYPCNFNWTRTGTWMHDAERFPRGLGPIGDKCHEIGAKFLLWFEPERIMEGSELWREHPEFQLSYSGRDDENMLNLADPACLAWLIDRVDGLIKDYKIDIYRQDFNFNPAPYWAENETEDRIGALENLHVQGYLTYWDALIERNPGLWVDSCASGGRRNDLETMRRAVPLHYTDVGYGKHPIKQKQHRFMFEWIPYFRAHNMSWDNDEGGYEGGGKPVDCYAFHCAMAPALTNMTFFDGPDEEFELASVMVPIWRRAAELELRGDYYPLTECRKDPHDWYAMQFDDPESGDGFVQLIRNTQAEEDSFELHMMVRDPEAVYFFENMETGDIMQLTGEQLQAGFKVSLSKREGIVWFYHTVTF